MDVETGPPRQLCRGPNQLRTAPIRDFDLGPDGRFVLARRRTADPAPSQIEVRIGGPARRARLSPLSPSVGDSESFAGL